MSVPKDYRDIVRTATIAAGAIGVPGAFSFGLDVTALSGTWVTMVLAIADRSGHKVDPAFAAKLVASTLAGVAGYVGGSKVLTFLLHTIPGAGTLTAIGLNSTLNALYTYKMGNALAKLFNKGDFAFNDVADNSIVLLGLIAGLPTPGEITDIIQIITVG